MVPKLDSKNAAEGFYGFVCRRVSRVLRCVGYLVFTRVRRFQAWTRASKYCKRFKDLHIAASKYPERKYLEFGKIVALIVGLGFRSTAWALKVFRKGFCQESHGSEIRKECRSGFLWSKITLNPKPYRIP